MAAVGAGLELAVQAKSGHSSTAGRSAVLMGVLGRAALQQIKLIPG